MADFTISTDQLSIAQVHTKIDAIVKGLLTNPISRTPGHRG